MVLYCRLAGNIARSVWLANFSPGLTIDALVGSLDGSLTFRKKIRGSKNNPENLGGKLAKDLLIAGAKIILDEVYKSARAK